MQRNRPPSPQTINVLRALAADPARWRYAYDLATEAHVESGSLYPILVRLADPESVGLLTARLVRARRGRSSGQLSHDIGYVDQYEYPWHDPLDGPEFSGRCCIVRYRRSLEV
jgi:hypothetical protein